MKQESNNRTENIPELRIIAEDETYALVAVPIRKALLARNVHFLAALIDIAAAPSILPIS